ncbi:MAG TPA: glycosyltransferase family 4 protein [Actinomycetota bacterium]|nr:glycosyltransferase family 4 protein [Actinomycetota bacterium]
MKIAVCHPTSAGGVGGAEGHVKSLVEALRAAGHGVSFVGKPYRRPTAGELVDQMAMWRSLDVESAVGGPVDLVVALKFPAYLVRHDHKVVWLMQQLHDAYELWEHHEYGRLVREEGGEAARRIVWNADREALGEAARLFATSRNVAGRLRRSLGLEATVLYHRSPLCERLLGRDPGAHGDYVLVPGRLESRKRQLLAVNAMDEVLGEVRLVLVGDGPDAGRLRARARRGRAAGRIELLSGVGDAELADLYRSAGAVCYPPFDEDYGYVTLEAFAAARPVVTTTDAGGPLEFVREGETGTVVPPDPGALAKAFDRLWADRASADRMGRAGREELLATIPEWPEVVARLLGDTPLVP